MSKKPVKEEFELTIEYLIIFGTEKIMSTYKLRMNKAN